MVSLESPVASDKDASLLGEFIEDEDYKAPDEAAL
jgi:DNA-directed RNA polymerase sigma subunit (sigma70/sigma32)